MSVFQIVFSLWLLDSELWVSQELGDHLYGILKSSDYLWLPPPFDSNNYYYFFIQFPYLLSLLQFPYSWCNCVSIAELYCFAMVRLLSKFLFSHSLIGLIAESCLVESSCCFSSVFSFSLGDSVWLSMISAFVGELESWALLEPLRASPHSISRWLVRLLTGGLRGPRGNVPIGPGRSHKIILI